MGVTRILQGNCMETPTLFDFPETLHRPKWDNKVMSYSFDEQQIIRWILTLHNNEQGVDVDPCYSVGRFWKGLPKPKHKYDIAPQAAGVEKADARHLPLSNESVSSEMFDPPFLLESSVTKPGIIKKRFSDFRNYQEMCEMYSGSMVEAYRVLKPNGLLIFKCQDFVHNSGQYMTHAFVMVEAQRIGFYIQDLFILLRENVLWSPNMEHQQHARKAHSYFIVLRKSTNQRLLKRTSLLEAST